MEFGGCNISTMNIPTRFALAPASLLEEVETDIREWLKDEPDDSSVFFRESNLDVVAASATEFALNQLGFTSHASLASEE